MQHIRPNCLGRLIYAIKVRSFIVIMPSSTPTIFHISTPIHTARLEYVLDFVIRIVGRLDYHLTIDPALSALHIKSPDKTSFVTCTLHGVLLQNDVSDVVLSDALSNSTKLLSNQIESNDFGEILGLLFLRLSGYQEYLNNELDHHGRFSIAACHWHSYGLAERPIADELAMMWLNGVCRQFNIPLRPPSSSIVSTIDIDYPWSYQHLKWPYRFWKSIKGSTNEMYDTYAELIKWHEDAGLTPTFFFLIPTNHRLDHTNRYQEGAMIHLLHQLSICADLGLHMPYESGGSEIVMMEAIEKYEQWTGFRPQISRQHYLRFSLARTMPLLEENNISVDYSVGYADAVGFRLGTAYRIPWFDLRDNRISRLDLCPLIAMDRSLRDYAGLMPDEMEHKLDELYSHIRTTGGKLTLLWHNSNINGQGWDDYTQVYRRILAW